MDDSGRNIETCRWGTKCVTQTYNFFRYKGVKWGTAGNPATEVSTFKIVDTRQQMNRIMCEADVSQIRSQTRILLKDQSQSGIRHLVSKLNRGVQAVQGIRERNF
ncbi:unnamed protein product [Rotaria socialis]|uniref:Uncharacterized protein n=1 Tax=Rotaria socialis TaxID=392032 RepID=A0A820M1U5_9BILA|nr:unnamed protein product [Rotaria socialis]CAF3324404.1 unnamed protein product [Rotaria socialis]CAF4367045.1 unnamed protein product [Rotaria socialis]